MDDIPDIAIWYRVPILAPILKTPLCIAISAQRPRSPLMRKAVEVIRDVVHREIRSAEILT
jgi:hypothetical protein